MKTMTIQYLSSSIFINIFFFLFFFFQVAPDSPPGPYYLMPMPWFYPTKKNIDEKETSLGL